jgi:calpain, invertebrate
LEKAYAKAMGNYEFSESGFPIEAMRFMIGAPTVEYNLTLWNNSTYIWDLLTKADNAGMIICATTYIDATDEDENAVGLPLSHAFTVLSTIQIWNADGTLKANLLKMRNPWGDDGDYNGTWNDGDAVWLTIGETYPI